MGEYRGILMNGSYIDGQWTKSGNGGLDVKDKYTGAQLGYLPYATEADMERAIACAAAFRKEFREWNAGRRAAMLNDLASLLWSESEKFVELIVREGGKPVSYARTEVERGLATLRMAAAEATRFGGEVVPLDFGIGAGKSAFTRRVPVGVVAGITPFNFPLNLVLHKVAPALAVGCPIIIKPAPQAPLTALALAEMAQTVAYPGGALQVVIADNAQAEKLVRDERIAMLSFTGSDKVGWHLKGIAGKKKLALELGGNAAVIVDGSTDLDQAAKAIAGGAYLYAGQICISTQRIYVLEAVREAFEEALIQAISKVQSGDPQKDVVINGPIIDRGHLERIDAWVQEAVQAGAKELAGGFVLDPEHNIYAPTLLTDTTESMKVCSEEVFGPVAVMESVRSFEEAIERVNAGRYGLQAGVFSNRIDHMRLAHERLEVGGVIIGGVPGFRIDSMPYGGVKDSGLGREGVRYAMEEMTEPRLMVY